MEVGGNFKVEDLVPTIGRSKKERNEKVKKKVRKKGVECDHIVGGDGGEAVGVGGRVARGGRRR